MSGETPTNRTRLDWQAGQAFEASTAHGRHTLESGDERHALTPMEAMLSAVAGCMAIDVVDILAKMRKTVTGYSIDCEGWRRDERPRRFTRIRLTHRVTGPDVDEAGVRRAVDLSHERYCSAMASLHPEIEVEHRIELTRSAAS